MWTTEQAINLCRKIERVAPEYGCHVALTGGLLYKDGPRKDCDVLIYRIRQAKGIDVEGLWRAMESIGITRLTEKPQWCMKGSYLDEPIDFFFPELPKSASEDYPKKAD